MVEYVVAWLPHSPMLAFDIFHMVVALESFYGCLLASCAAPPSSRATEDDLSYTISFLIIFISSVQEILPLTNFVFKWSQPLVWKRNINFRQLVPSPLISTFLASCTPSQRNPDK
jgi:hypothetical protein